MAASVPDRVAERPSRAASSPYSVKLPVFEGPLDLLLHLIRVNEVEITDIPIARIGEQYLRYLDVMRELDLDVVGEYLLMAATLAWIKSRMLLPAERVGEDGEEIDPRAELVARLLEYQRFKEVAQELEGRNRLGRDVFAAHSLDLQKPADSDREIEVGLFDLVDAYRLVLEAKRDVEPEVHEIESEEITIRERMLAIMQVLEVRSSVEFDVFLSDEHRNEGGDAENDGRTIRKPVVVATFIAMLELTRLAAIRIYQSIDELGVPAGPIHLRLAVAGGDRSWAKDLPEHM
ncbi:MAG: segregation/condensation protein A [Myxococcota bacterium]